MQTTNSQKSQRIDIRYILRNFYAYQLEEERVLRLADILPNYYTNFVKDIEILIENI